MSKIEQHKNENDVCSFTENVGIKSMLLTSSSSSTRWQSNLLAPEIAAPKSASLG